MIRRLLLTGAIALAWTASSAQTKEQKWEACADGAMNFIVANDLGRNGYFEQKPIASLMGEVADAIGPEAVFALGDVHHYGGVQSITDPLWMTNYELIYTNPELLTDWYAICGNHEYRGSTQAVVDYSNISRRWNMPSRYYAKTFTHKGTSVKIVFIDTTPLISKYRNDPATYPDARMQDAKAQLEWLDKELSNQKEDWVIVVGHHPVYADTDKDTSERSDLQQTVDPILRKHKVAMYICGHIHNFQHITKPDSPVDYIVNGSGSRARRKVKPVDGTVFTSGHTGFSILDVAKHKLTLSMLDEKGNVIHQIHKKK